jgi:hypothetical protein
MTAHTPIGLVKRIARSIGHILEFESLEPIQESGRGEIVGVDEHCVGNSCSAVGGLARRETAHLSFDRFGEAFAAFQPLVAGYANDGLARIECSFINEGRTIGATAGQLYRSLYPEVIVFICGIGLTVMTGIAGNMMWIEIIG